MSSSRHASRTTRWGLSAPASAMRAALLAPVFAALLAGCTDEPQPTEPAVPLRPSMAAPAAGGIRYQYTGNKFDFFCFGPFDAQVCSASGEGTSYSTSDFVTAVITLDAPLPPNLLLQDLGGYAGFHLVMSDGHQTLTSAPGAIVSTDAAGHIVEPWFVHTNGPVPPNNGIGTVNWPDVRGVGDVGALSAPTGSTLDTPFDIAWKFRSSGTWTILLDLEPPLLTVPADMAVEATSAAGAVVVYSASATDNVDPAPAVSCDRSSGSTFPLGNTTVTCTATDATGNTATASFLVMVVDTTSPVLSLPADFAVDATSPSGAIVSYTVSAADAVSVPTVSCSPGTGSLFGVGAHTVSCIATDAAGNSTAGSFAVTVKGAAEQITDLQGTVSGLALLKGTETSLTQQLAAASSALALGDRDGACDALQGLISHVIAQSGKKISAADAAILIAEAERIRTVLGC